MASNAAYYDTAMDSPKLCQDIFSILESQFLSGALKPSFPAVYTAGKVRILSIDHSEGDLAAASLIHLESALRRLSGDPSASLSHFFDLAVGSGSGALLASLLFANNLSAKKASLLLSEIQLDKSKTRTRFGKLFKKESKVFNKVFGEATLKDASKPLLITCYDLNTGAPFVFSRADAVEADGFDFKIRDVCEAATCKRKVKKEVRSVDGETRVRVLDAGASSNPTAVGITHVMHNKQEFPFVNGLEDVFVLSIGGNGARVSDAVSVARASQADMVDQAVAMAFGERRKSNYIRIQGNGINVGSPAEDILSEASVESVLFQGKKMVKETYAERLEWAAGLLLKEQQRRQQSKIPTVFIKPAVTPPRTSSSSAMTLTTLTGSSESPRF
ncbi:patatin-like protein 3 [Carex littledalei]|uniref:Patatin-like protein 3 n=1 Tax=Carex littledalei TaxID=544730 RepID=A0A833QP76_9POAL|nr:patatin-like protein 3 [Carex littledalei]